MYKQLVRIPLEQAMMLVWVVGLIQLCHWLSQGPPTWSWMISASLSAMVLVLIAGRIRKPQLLPLAVVIGLGAVLGAVHRLGPDSVDTLFIATVGYGLILWRVMLHALHTPATIRLIRLLGLSGGYGTDGGCRAVESVVHWSAFLLIILSLAFSAGANLVSGIAPSAPWSVLVLSLIFLWLAAKRYRRRLHASLLIAVVVWCVIDIYTRLISAGQVSLAVAQPFYDSGLGLVVSSSAVIILGVSEWIIRRTGSENSLENSLAGLYYLPLRNAVVVLAGLAGLHTVALIMTAMLVAPAWNSLAALALASMALLLVNRVLARKTLSVIGALIAVIVILWTFSAVMYDRLPFGLWPGHPDAVDQWLVLALSALFLSSVAQFVSRYPEWIELYSRPLSQMAWLVYFWTLSGSLALFSYGKPATVWLFVVLIAGLFPLLRPIGDGAKMRGVGIALLTTLGVAAWLGPKSFQHWEVWAVWGYGLWAIANFILPRFNAYFPNWQVVTTVWPWLGLLVLAGGGLSEVSLIDTRWLLPSSLVLMLAGYMLLMLRHSTWQGFSWLAVFFLVWAGLAFSLGSHREAWIAFDMKAITWIAIETLGLANLLLLSVPLWRRYGRALVAQLGFCRCELESPLMIAALIICGIWLSAFVVWDGALILNASVNPSKEGLAAVIGLLVSLTYLHGLGYRPTLVNMHLLVFSAFLTALAGWESMSPFPLPLVFALWGMFLTLLSQYTPSRQRGLMNLLHRTLTPWLTAMPLTTLFTMALVPEISLIEGLLTLTLLSGIAGVRGWGSFHRGWFFAAAVPSVVVMHGVWFVWVSWDDAFGILPWFALQFTVITWGLRRVTAHLQGHCSHTAESHADYRPKIVQILVMIIPWLGGLALVEWVFHGLVFVDSLLLAEDSQAFGGVWSTMAALATALALIAMGIQQARASQGSGWVYTVGLITALTGCYCRLYWVGLAPLTVWDTGAIIIAAYALFIVQRLTLSQPVLNLVMIVPLAALATVPFQLGSAHAGVTLLAVAILYLLTRRVSGRGTPMYLGLLAVNAGVYLWVPGWADRYGLWQVYLIPASISVLWLLHMHRNELKQKVLNGARLAALSTLYAAATLDIFLQETLGVFVLALTLSITGIIVGIMLRTRAFLYAGVAFLVLNVIGQIGILYPEQRLGRALILMALGAGITGLMIWFNIKREAFTERIRLVRADLGSWD
jgi:hypothetical protein